MIEQFKEALHKALIENEKIKIEVMKSYSQSEIALRYGAILRDLQVTFNQFEASFISQIPKSPNAQITFLPGVNMPVAKKCLYCKTNFYPHTKVAQYCCARCRVAAFRKSKTDPPPPTPEVPAEPAPKQMDLDEVIARFTVSIDDAIIPKKKVKAKLKELKLAIPAQAKDPRLFYSIEDELTPIMKAYLLDRPITDPAHDSIKLHKDRMLQMLINVPDIKKKYAPAFDIEKYLLNREVKYNNQPVTIIDVAYNSTGQITGTITLLTKYTDHENVKINVKLHQIYIP